MEPTNRTFGTPPPSPGEDAAPNTAPTSPPLPPHATAPSGSSLPPPASAPSNERHPADDWWFDERRVSSDAAPPTDNPKRPLRTWVAVGVGATVLGVASIVGINVASSKLSSANASTNARGAFGPGGAGQNGAPGAMAQGPGAAGQSGAGMNPGGRGGLAGDPGGMGTIESIEGSTLILSTPMGDSTKVITDGSTRFSTSVTGSIGDIKVGDNVVVMGSTVDNTVTALRITDTGDIADAGPGAGGPPPGQVPDAGQGQGQLPAPGQAPDGGATGPASGGTGQQAPAGAAANGNQAGSGGSSTGQARNGGPRGSAIRGVVASVDGSTIVVTTKAGTTMTVSTTSSPTVTVQRTSSLADLKTGDTVRAVGTADSEGSITATNVVSGIDPAGAPGGAGQGGPAGAPGQNGQRGSAGQGGFPGGASGGSGGQAPGGTPTGN